MTRQDRLGIIGSGQMAEAIVRGLIETRLYAAESILSTDISEERREAFRKIGVGVTAEASEVVENCGTLLIAVKPQNLSDLLPRIGRSMDSDHLLISICAGTATTTFESAAVSPLRVVRAMPNLPVKLRQGATALTAGRYAGPEDVDLAKRIFQAVGEVVIVEERLMDAVTALSGSGPAYVYFLAEAMIEAGIREGLSGETARDLAVQTIIGAGAMLRNDPASPQEHRRRVTSKGGTTEAAFNKIEETGVREALIAAIAAAAERGRELGRR
jgi:pyrroline-5-carboxylate reductase